MWGELYFLGYCFGDAISQTLSSLEMSTVLCISLVFWKLDHFAASQKWVSKLRYFALHMGLSYLFFSILQRLLLIYFENDIGADYMLYASPKTLSQMDSAVIFGISSSLGFYNLRNGGINPFLAHVMILPGHVVAITPITTENINTAVDTWCNNPTSAEETYGHISTWLVHGSRVCLYSSRRNS